MIHTQNVNVRMVLGIAQMGWNKRMRGGSAIGAATRTCSVNSTLRNVLASMLVGTGRVVVRRGKRYYQTG